MRTPNNLAGTSPFRSNYQRPYEMHPNPLSKLNTSPSLPKFRYRTNLQEFEIKPYDSLPKTQPIANYLTKEPSQRNFNYESNPTPS
jgi:hypothetical protein